MKSLIIITILCISSITFAQNTRYVAPTNHKETPGSDSNGDGSFSAPWETLQRAINEAKPGDTVYIRGGLYKTSKPAAINPFAFPSPVGVSGTKESPIHYFGFPPDIENRDFPIIDCIQHCDSIVNEYGDVYNAGLYLNKVEYIHFKDIVIRNVFQCDSVLSGGITTEGCANLTFENITLHNIGQRGYWMTGGAWGEHAPDPIFEHDTTRWINCDVYDLFDTLATSPGNAADGWKTIHYKGNVLIWQGCRAWYYSDDGWDPTPVDGAQRIFKNCWAMASNKYRNNDGYGWQTERNAFKLNSDHPENELFEHNSIIMINCLAMYSNHGFYEIGATPPNGIYYNNTAFKNNIGFGARNHSNSVYKNNLVFGSTGEDPGLKLPYDVAIHSNTTYTESHNTWDKTTNYPHFKMTDSLELNYADFVTVDSVKLDSLFRLPRNIDGSLPPFPLQLAPDSDLKDAGIDVNLPFNGSAPDIGAYEIGRFKIDFKLPQDGFRFKEGEKVPLNAIVYDPVFEVDSVVFFSKKKQNKLGVSISSNNSLWQADWVADQTGQIDLRAVAYSSSGDSATSSRINIILLPSDGSITESQCNVRYYPENHNLFQIILPDITSSTEVNLISLDGRIHLAGRLSANSSPIFDLDLTGFPAGFYALQFINETNEYICGSESIKLIKYK